MNAEQIKKIIEDTDDDSGENTFGAMVRDFYSRRMLSMVIFIWVWALIFMAGAVISAVLFFITDLTKDHILYAALFITFMLFVSMMKIFAWQMIHRNNIKREIKRLELAIAQLAEIIKNK